jgi:SAM-dependent methyltransferase
MAQQRLRDGARSIGGGFLAIFRIVYHDVVRSESLLSFVLLLRIFYFCSLKRGLRTMGADDAFPVTVQHNLKSLIKKLNRMALLIKPLSALEQVAKDARILVIGPRNEWDLLLLHRYGFDFSQCSGLDLISYSPKILLGDMHAMPFADGEFDVVLCGWTISYSANPALACQEIARVCKANGTIGIGVEYFVGDQEAEREAVGGYVIQDERLSQRINTVDQIMALFPKHGALFFSHDAPLKRSAPRQLPPSNCAVIFQNG